MCPATNQLKVTGMIGGIKCEYTLGISQESWPFSTDQDAADKLLKPTVAEHLQCLYLEGKHVGRSQIAAALAFNAKPRFEAVKIAKQIGPSQA